MRSARAITQAVVVALGIAALIAVQARSVRAAQEKGPHWTAEQAPIATKIGELRAMADDVRAKATKMLALQIRALPTSSNKVALAYGLANLSTEGDFGHDTVQQVATTLADALRERPVKDPKARPAEQYVELASLVRYEHVSASVNDPQFQEAAARLRADDERREHISFTLAGLDGKQWTLRDLRGKVVLVNFWATWCPPCRKEMPDLDALYKRFKGQGFVVLAISDEKAGTVRSFLADHKVAYPVLLDPGDRVHKRFDVDGIPKSYVYNRDGKLVAESMDMRTRAQFLGMLAKAGLE